MKIPGAAKMRASVLDCGSPLPLFHSRFTTRKRQRAAAVQGLTDYLTAIQNPASDLITPLLLQKPPHLC
jgi:hypothetical protein